MTVAGKKVNKVVFSLRTLINALISGYKSFGKRFASQKHASKCVLNV